MLAVFTLAVVLINVLLPDGKQAFRIYEESALGRHATTVDLLVTVSFGSSVCSNSICYFIEVHRGKKRQHLMSIFVATLATASGVLTMMGLSPTYYNERADWMYVSHTLPCISWSATPLATCSVC